jgi:hypothetical protein
VQKTLLLNWIILAGLPSCGADQNLMGILTPKSHKESFSNLLSTGRAAYDRGDIVKADQLSKAAYDIDPSSVEASLLYGLVNLSLAGADPYSLVRTMNKSKSDEDDESSTSSALKPVQDALAISQTEVNLLGELETSDPDLPVLLPGCMEDVRSAVPRLQYLDKAIKAICPFVQSIAKTPDDARQVCTEYLSSAEETGRIHFLWSFSHLAEAVMINSALTYTTTSDGGGENNLTLRVKKAESQLSAGDITAILSTFSTLDKVFKRIFPINGVCSTNAPTTQSIAFLNDLLAVDGGFAVIATTPPNIRKAIQKAVAKLKESRGSGQSSRQKDTFAVKSEMAGGLSKSLGSGISSAISSGAVQGPAKAALCDSFVQISAGTNAVADGCG